MHDMPHLPNNASLLTLSTAAALLDVSPSTVARWAKDGSLANLVLHRGARKVTRRFRREDIARLIQPASSKRQ